MKRRCVAQVVLVDGAGPRDAEEVAQALLSASEELGAVRASHASVHYDFAVGGGDLTWDLFLESEATAGASASSLGAALVGVMNGDRLGELLPSSLGSLASRVERVEFAQPELIASGTNVPGLVGVKRTLWMRVKPAAPPDLVERFEAETPILADAIPAIRNWRWSRIPKRGFGGFGEEDEEGEGRAAGSKAEGGEALRWTHLWEQEFETVDGLQIDYMSSPVHWGFIDRYFDPEMPDCIIDPWLAHLACPETAPVLSWDLDR